VSCYIDSVKKDFYYPYSFYVLLFRTSRVDAPHILCWCFAPMVLSIECLA